MRVWVAPRLGFTAFPTRHLGIRADFYLANWHRHKNRRRHSFLVIAAPIDVTFWARGIRRAADRGRNKGSPEGVTARHLILFQICYHGMPNAPAGGTLTLEQPPDFGIRPQDKMLNS
jgi:hypothetical protein